MKTPLCTAISVLSVSFLISATKAGDTLLQVSTIDALMKGIFDGKVSFGELKKRGDFGIGTLDNLDGEMLALDGKFYQITSDGAVKPIPDEVETPFAAVVFFEGEKTVRLGATESLAKLQEKLDAEVSSTNLFHAVKVTGTFPLMNLRSVARQEPPFRTLPEVAKEQSLFNLTEVKGTLVGFRCPEYVKGLNVPGYHFHFLSEDGKQGGHVLDCAVAGGAAEIDTLENFTMFLPKDREFMTADFSEHDAKGLEAVEQIKKESVPAAENSKQGEAAEK
jgi:acetolactate decarboxylase